MKKLFLAALLAFASPLSAQTITGDCDVAFDFPVEQEPQLDGFRFTLNAAPGLEITPEARGATCAELGVIPGLNTLTVEAFNALGESAPSNTLTFYIVESAPTTAPTALRLVIGFH